MSGVIRPARRCWIPASATALGAASLGLYVARSAGALLYAREPALLEGAVALVLGSVVALSAFLPWLALCLFSRGNSANTAATLYASVMLPLAALSAVLLRPFPDATWSGLVLAAAGGGSLLAVGQTAGWWGAKVPPDRAVPHTTSGHLAAALAAMTAFAVYLRTVAPSVVAGDSAEFQTVGYTLGIAHPTGYPLYLLLAKAFTFLPAGNVAFRVNLLSSVLAAAALYVFVLTARRLCGDSRAALIAGLTLAFSAIFWSQAVIAEVYALAAFFVLVILYLLIRGLRDSSADLRPWSLWLALGLSLTHHRVTLLLGPALLAFMLSARRRGLVNPIALLAATALVILPLVLYFYLPLRWPVEYGEALDWERFRWHVMASGYSFALRLESLWEQPDRYWYFLDLLREQFGVSGLFLGVAGWLVLVARRRTAVLITSLAFLAFALFPVAYHVPDVAVFGLPGFAVFALWIAAGVAAAMRLCNGLLGAKVGLPAGAGLALALAALLPGFLLVTNYERNDASGDLTLDRVGRTILAQDIEPGAIVVADMQRMSALRYFFGVEAPERAVVPAMPDTESYAKSIIADRLAAGQPVYLARFLPGLESKYRLNAAGPLVSVAAGATKSPLPAVPQLVRFPGQVVLTGFTPGPAEVAAGQSWGIALFWRAEEKLSDSHYVHVRLVDESGAAAYVAKPGIPVQGLYPTWAWPMGEVVADYREVPLPLDLPPGSYRVEVGLGGAFRPPGQWATITPLRVLPTVHPAALRPFLAAFEKHVALVGYDWGGTPRPGGKIKLALRWQSLAGTSLPAAKAHVSLRDSLGATVVALDGWVVPPGEDSGVMAAGREPAGGSIWLQFHELPLPGDAAPGTHRLVVRLNSGDGRPLAARSGWPAVVGSEVLLDEVVVASPPAEALTNLENKVILARHVFEQTALTPGDAVKLTLYWQAAAKIEQDYTVFVHLLDRAGRVRAQVDAFPVGGLRPTSQWRPGDTVLDAYQVPVPDDLPAGEYEVEVGMYLAASMERLQVIDEEERPIDDRVIVGTVRVGGK